MSEQPNNQGLVGEPGSRARLDTPVLVIDLEDRKTAQDKFVDLVREILADDDPDRAVADDIAGLQIQVGRVGSGVGGIYESYGRGWVDKPSDQLEKSYTKDDEWNEMVIDFHRREDDRERRRGE